MFSQAQGYIDSVILETYWSDINTPWIIFRPVLSEGTISLIITLSSALALANFYYGYKHASNLDVTSSQNIPELLSKMDISYLIMSGNILAGIKRIFQANRIINYKSLFHFSLKLAFPICVYILVTLISGACQASVHSTLITHQDSKSGVISSASLTEMLYGNHVASDDNVIDVALYNPNIAQAVISNKDYSTNGFFFTNGLFCAGSSDPNLSFKTTCVKDATSCTDLPYSIDPGAVARVFVLNNSTNSSLRYIRAGGSNILDAGVVPWAVGFQPNPKLKSIQEVYYYIGLAGSAPGSTYYNMSSDYTLHNIYGYNSGNRAGVNVSVWAGSCYHQMNYCTAEVKIGNVSISNCSLVSPFLSKSKLVGVALPLQNHFTLRTSMANIMTADSSIHGYSTGKNMLYKSIGLLSFASYLSLQKFSDFNTTKVSAEYVTVYRDNGIAMDLISTLLIILFCALTSIYALYILFLSRNHDVAISYSQRRLRWDPVTKLASELSQKHELGFDHGCWERKKDNSKDCKKYIILEL